MTFAKTKEELVERGYRFDGSGTCKGPRCGARIDWYKTPKGRNIPMNADTATPHWETCPDRRTFK